MAQGRGICIQILVALVGALAGLECCLGVEHDLGAWQIGKQADYKRWSQATTFKAGDTLKFSYPAPTHNVWALGSQAEYDNCDVSKPIKMFNEANAVVPLAKPGKKFYVCGVEGHCAAGMKVVVNVVGADSPAASPVAEAPAPDSAAISLSSLSSMVLAVVVALVLGYLLATE